MLSQLYINNIAVIQKATIELTDGLNVFTGETGAGKTILINAINAVLGGRTPKDLIRHGESKAVVSAVFTDLSDAHIQALSELGLQPEEDGSLLITREISADSKTVCRINGQPATVSMLKAAASRLIDIHGQHDNQQLTAPERHIGFIDSFGKLEEALCKYTQLYSSLKALEHEEQGLQMSEADKAARIELLEYQIDEISKATLQPGEEEELTARRKLIRNSEKLTALLADAIACFDGEDREAGLLELLDGAVDDVRGIGEYIPETSDIFESMENMSYELADFRDRLVEALSRMEYDPRELEHIEARLDVLYRVKRKYGGTVEAALLHLEQAQEELDGIVLLDERRERLAREREKALAAAQKEAAALSAQRAKAAELFTKRVSEELSFLDMPAVRFTVRHDQVKLRENGMDEMELLISTNPGEPPKPISKIASGGELSRIMLAIKNVWADIDDIPTSIFDEIDTGVSGRAAQKIGQKLRQAAGKRQILCVTHLAQVAAFGENHLLIEKSVCEGKTFTEIRPLSKDERVDEIARIMSGEEITQAARKNAQELLSMANDA